MNDKWARENMFNIVSHYITEDKAKLRHHYLPITMAVIQKINTVLSIGNNAECYGLYIKNPKASCVQR